MANGRGGRDLLQWSIPPKAGRMTHLDKPPFTEHACELFEEFAKLPHCTEVQLQNLGQAVPEGSLRAILNLHSQCVLILAEQQTGTFGWTSGSWALFTSLPVLSQPGAGDYDGVKRLKSCAALDENQARQMLRVWNAQARLLGLDLAPDAAPARAPRGP